MKKTDLAFSMILTVALCALAIATSPWIHVALADPPPTDEGAQKQTMADIRNLGTAMFSWLTDQVGAAAAGQSEMPAPQTVDFDKYPEIYHADLEALLTPAYMEHVPELDGWNRLYEVYLNTANPMAEKIMSIRSSGRDGVYSDTVYTVTAFDPESFDEDIAWADGFFVRWPLRN
jgi:hypothetical protein